MFESFSYFDYGLKDDYVPYVYFSVNEDHQIKLYLTDVHDNSNEKVYDFNLSENDYQTVVNLFDFWKESNEKNNVLVYFKDTILEIVQKYGTEEEYNEINEYFKAITDANIRLKSK